MSPGESAACSSSSTSNERKLQQPAQPPSQPSTPFLPLSGPILSCSSSYTHRVSQNEHCWVKFYLQEGLAQAVHASQRLLVLAGAQREQQQRALKGMQGR